MANFVSLNGAGNFVIWVNDVEVDYKGFDDTTKESISFDLTTYIANNPTVFAPGQKIVVKLSLEDYDSRGNNEDFKLAYSLNGKYYNSQPDTIQSDLDFSVSQKFSSNALGKDNKIGDEFKYSIELRNKNTTRAMGMVVMEFRLPSCLEVNY